MTDYTDGLLRGGGHLQVALSDADRTLTDDEARSRSLEVIGTLTATRTLNLPRQAGWSWTVKNSTSWPVAIGDGCKLRPSERSVVVFDGTTFVRASGDLLVASADVSGGDATLSLAQSYCDVLVVQGAGVGARVVSFSASLVPSAIANRTLLVANRSSHNITLEDPGGNTPAVTAGQTKLLLWDEDAALNLVG